MNGLYTDSTVDERNGTPPHHVAMVAVIAGGPPIVTTMLGAVLPVTPEQLELLQAGGAIIGVLTAAMIWLTFGRLHQREQAHRERLRTERRTEPTFDDSEPLEPIAHRRHGVSFHLRQIGRHDTAFSEVDVQAWLPHLLSAVRSATAEQARTTLRPYLAIPAWEALQRALSGVEEVEVGPRRIIAAEHDSWDILHVRVGLMLRRSETWEPRLQDWVLRRSTSARSLPLADMRALGCPACGGAVDVKPPEWACAVCEQRIGDGQLHWQLIEVNRIPDDALRHPSWRPDAGGDHASVRVPVPQAPDLAAALRALRSRCPEFDLHGLDQRIRDAFVHGTGLEAERRFEALTYQRLRLQRATSGISVDEVQLVHVSRDGWYERIDVRVLTLERHALLDADGHIVDGNDEVPRRTASIVRLAARSGEPCAPDAWFIWSVVRPQEYVA